MRKEPELRKPQVTGKLRKLRIHQIPGATLANAEECCSGCLKPVAKCVCGKKAK